MREEIYLKSGYLRRRIYDEEYEEKKENSYFCFWDQNLYCHKKPKETKHQCTLYCPLVKLNGDKINVCGVEYNFEGPVLDKNGGFNI